MKNKKPTWSQLQAQKKRTAAIKASLLAKATEGIERMWSVSLQVDSGFSPAERKAIATASNAIRSIKGGWLGRGRP